MYKCLCICVFAMANNECIGVDSSETEISFLSVKNLGCDIFMNIEKIEDFSDESCDGSGGSGGSSDAVDIYDFKFLSQDGSMREGQEGRKGHEGMDKEWCYVRDIELEGYQVFTNMNCGVNHKRLFKGCDIVSKDRYLKGEPCVKIKELKKWGKKIMNRKRIKAFNSKGWIKRDLGGGVGGGNAKRFDPEKLMILFVKKV